MTIITFYESNYDIMKNSFNTHIHAHAKKNIRIISTREALMPTEVLTIRTSKCSCVTRINLQQSVLLEQR